MTECSREPKQLGPADPNEVSERIFRAAAGEELDQSGESEKYQAAVELSRVGGEGGGEVRATKRSAAGRMQIARRASRARRGTNGKDA